jgi:epoxyqueuosine reductase
MQQLKYRDILYNDDPIGPYPTHLLKRVDKPTNRVPGPVQRVDARSSVFGKSFLGEFGEEIQREFMRMTARYPVGGALVDLQHHINTYKAAENPVAAKKAPIPDDPRVLSRHIKSLGHFLGADIVGIGRLPQSAVYTHDMIGNAIEAPFKYAICLMCRKHVPTLSASNGWEEIVDPASFQAYQRLALQTEVMANYIRRLGHEAEATNAYTYLTLMPEIVLACGLGEVSRMGIILNPFLGTNCKTAAVLTNLELEVDGYVDFGLQDYCESCSICARPVPVPRHHTGQADAAQWLLHVEAQRQGVQRLRCVEQGRLRLRPLHLRLSVEPAAYGRPRFRGVGRQPGVAARYGERAARTQQRKRFCQSR